MPSGSMFQRTARMRASGGSRSYPPERSTVALKSSVTIIRFRRTSAGTGVGVAVKVGDGVNVGVNVAVGVKVGLGVKVGVDVGVSVRVGVLVLVGLGVGGMVGVGVGATASN